VKRRLPRLTADLPLLGLPKVKTLSRDEAQEVVDAAMVILDGLKVLLALTQQGNREAADALRQWGRILDDVQRFRG
jgi:DNA-binding PadR family transcriptional regulator